MIIDLLKQLIEPTCNHEYYLSFSLDIPICKYCGETKFLECREFKCNYAEKENEEIPSS